MGVSAPESFSERIQRALGAGKSREDVVRELMATGLSRHTAERFVERALSERKPASGGAPAPHERAEAAEDSGGRGALVSGALWFSLGCTVTGATFLLASPGQEYLVAYGAVVAGLLAFGRGLKRWWDTAQQPFPWMAVFKAAAVPPAFTLVLGAALSGYQYSRKETRRAEEAERLEQTRAIQEDARAALERKAADEERARRHADRVARAREQLQNSSSPMTRCEVALDLGHARAQEAIPDLTAVLNRVTESVSVRNCAAGALAELGETELALAFYLECARAGTSDCRRISIGGFKDIGPPAAEVAIPYIREALESPHVDVRYLAVEALSKLGPAAEPLLREASLDSDQGVRQRAAQALGK